MGFWIRLHQVSLFAAIASVKFHLDLATCLKFESLEKLKNPASISYAQYIQRPFWSARSYRYRLCFF